MWNSSIKWLSSFGMVMCVCVYVCVLVGIFERFINYVNLQRSASAPTHKNITENARSPCEALQFGGLYFIIINIEDLQIHSM